MAGRTRKASQKAQEAASSLRSSPRKSGGSSEKETKAATSKGKKSPAKKGKPLPGGVKSNKVSKGAAVNSKAAAGKKGGKQAPPVKETKRKAAEVEVSANKKRKKEEEKIEVPVPHSIKATAPLQVEALPTQPPPVAHATETLFLSTALRQATPDMTQITPTVSPGAIGPPISSVPFVGMGGDASSKVQEWTAQEDATVIDQLKSLRGGTAAEKNMTVREAEAIQHLLPKRTVNAIKFRWNDKLKRRGAEQGPGKEPSVDAEAFLSSLVPSGGMWGGGGAADPTVERRSWETC